MKKIKKIAAGLMAVTAMATSMTGISASAYEDSDTWSTWHTYSSAPVYSGQSDSVTINYSTNGSIGYRLGQSVTVPNANGYVYVSCTNGSMTSFKWYKSYSDTQYFHPTQSGIITCTSYSLYAYSVTSGSTYSANGQMDSHP